MNRALLIISVVVMWLGAICTSRAETWNCGPRDEEGNYGDSVKCTYDESTKTLTISGEGNMGGYSSTKNDTSSAPWCGKDIKYAVIEKGVTSIGSRVFKSQSNLESISGLENINYIGNAAFAKADKLKSLDIPNVKEIGGSAFLATPNLIYIGLPETATINSYRNDVLYELGCITKNGYKICGSCGNEYVMSGLGCVSDCGEGYLGKEGRCIDSVLGCGDGYRQFENFCNRIRWTPAEAAKVLHDDNTNSVTITFKK